MTPKWLQLTALAAVTCAVAACPSVKIGQAQDAFNEAATIEIAATATASDYFATPGQNAAVKKYEATVTLLDSVIASDAAGLAADNLLGNAHTLRALSLWRMSDLADDVSTAEKADAAAEDAAKAVDGKPSDLGPRDRVIVKAVKGLTDCVRGRLAASYDDPLKGARKCYETGLGELEKSVADADLAPLHPIRIWVALCELRACQQWLFVVNATLGKPGLPQGPLNSETEAAVTAWKKHVMELKPFLAIRPQLVTMIRRLAVDMGVTDEELKPVLAAVLPARDELRFADDRAFGLPELAPAASR